MCWHTVTLCLNPKLFFFFFSFWKRRREVNLWRCSCLPWLLWIGRFLKLSKCFTPPLFAPGLCQGSHLWGEQSYWWPRPPRLTSPQNWATVHPQAHDYWWWLFLRPSSSSPHVSVCSLSACPLLRLSPVTGQTDKATAPLLTVSLGVLCFLFMNGDFVSVTAPLRRYLDDKRLVPFTKYYWFPPRREEDVYGWNEKKKGFSNNLRKLQNFIYNAETIVYRGNLFFCVCKFVITGLFLPIFI